MKIPRLVVFDMAGTTVEDGAGNVAFCLQAALQNAGYNVSLSDINRVMGLPKPEAIRLLTNAEQQTVSVLHADFVARMQNFYRTDTSVMPVAGAETTFAALRRAGILVALNTGFSRPIADLLLDRFDWHDKIDGSITSDEVAHGRPHPDMIFALMNRFGITNACDVAKVGDTPSDLEEGTGAGCGLIIGVTNGSHTREELARFPYTHLIESVAELPDLFFQSSRTPA